MTQITHDDIENCQDTLPVITYLAGYCCYTVNRKLKCSFCKDLLTCSDGFADLPENHIFIKGISRGGLLYPDARVVNIVMYNYIILNKLTQNTEFMRALNQRNLVTEITLRNVDEKMHSLQTTGVKQGTVVIK